MNEKMTEIPKNLEQPTGISEDFRNKVENACSEVADMYNEGVPEDGLKRLFLNDLYRHEGEGHHTAAIVEETDEYVVYASRKHGHGIATVEAEGVECHPAVSSALRRVARKVSEKQPWGDNNFVVRIKK